jgi:hypothetical protein
MVVHNVPASFDLCVCSLAGFDFFCGCMFTLHALCVQSYLLVSISVMYKHSVFDHAKQFGVFRPVFNLCCSLWTTFHAHNRLILLR